MPLSWSICGVYYTLKVNIWSKTLFIGVDYWISQNVKELLFWQLRRGRSSDNMAGKNNAVALSFDNHCNGKYFIHVRIVYVFWSTSNASFTPSESKHECEFFLWSLTLLSVNSWIENSSTHLLVMSLLRSLLLGVNEF